MKSIIIGTAGHIDHGKSALVHALTGTDPDRWEEEKRRGITIDLGFATLQLQNEYMLGFVDVPGHERFVKNMLAGVGGIDLLLLVIAADQSIQPQTREHFDICRLLGISRGIVVLTKSDLVDPDVLDLCCLEAEEFVAGSFLESAPIIAVSARTGEGMDRLRDELARAAAETPAKDSSRHFRLPIDRSFLIKGFGTVVTGTLVSGQVQKGGEVEAHPGGRKLRVRSIQVHGQDVVTAAAGQRTAINLPGTAPGELERGMVLTEPSRFVPTRRVDCLLHLLPDAPALKNGARVHFHAGTAEVIATTVCYPSAFGATLEKKIDPGETAYVQLRLRKPVLLFPGDRFIIRRLSPVITIGGGRVLDNWVPLHTVQVRSFRADRHAEYLPVLERGSREEILAQLVSRSPTSMLELADVVARTGWPDREVREAVRKLQDSDSLTNLSTEPLRFAATAHIRDMCKSTEVFLAKHHQANPLLPGVSVEALRKKVFVRSIPLIAETVLKKLATGGRIVLSGETVRLASHKIVLRREEEAAKQQITRAFQSAGLTVPTVREVLRKLALDSKHANKILCILLQEAVLVRVSEDLVFHANAISRLRQLLDGHKQGSNRIKVGAFKDLAQVSRKYAIPLLEYLDREKVTRRTGDERIIL